MQQSCRWTIKHAPISVGGTRYYPFKQTQNAAHAINLVEGRTKVHL
jgi:hypothetical protein